MSDTAKFWVQTLIIPVILAFVGYLINNTLQKQQRALDRIKFTDQVINEAFDSKNPDKTIALASIIPAIIDDKEFADTLKNLINKYYLRMAKEAVLTANDSVYARISDAAKAFNGNGITLFDSLKKNPTTGKAEQARQYEQQGLTHLQEGNLAKAHKSFKKAEAVYPGFHSSYEIANLLDSNLKKIKEGASDSSEIKKEVLQTVKTKYAWKLNPAIKTRAIKLPPQN